MDFDIFKPLNKLPTKLLVYSKEDFREEELKLIKVYCDSLSNRISHNDKHLLFENKILKPKNLSLEGDLEYGFNLLKEKRMTIENGLCFRTYLYYEEYLTGKLEYTNNLCKLIEAIMRNEAEIKNPNTTFFSFIGNYYHRPLLKTYFLAYILNDLGYIQISFGLSDYVRKDYRYYQDLKIYEITDKCRDFYRDICPLQRFKELINYIKRLKEKYLFESYSNIQVRITALVRDSFWEIIYIRFDFTNEKTLIKKPRYNYPNKEVVLFEEIIEFEKLINCFKVEGSLLTYNPAEFTFEFVYFIKFPSNFSRFKEFVKPTFHLQRIECKDPLNFIYFDLLESYLGGYCEFDFKEIIKKEFRDDSTKVIKNSTEVINEFMGYNLNSLSLPFIIIVYPIKSFEILNIVLGENIDKKIKITWTVNPDYDTYFRCKTTINGIQYEIPKEGFDIAINENSPRSFPCDVQWNGKSDLVSSDEILATVGIKNPHYKEKSIKDYKALKGKVFEKINKHLEEAGILEKETRNIQDKTWQSLLEYLGRLLIQSYNKKNSFLKSAEKWKKEIEMHEWFHSKFQGFVQEHNFITYHTEADSGGGKCEHFINNIPIEDKIVDKSDNREMKEFLEEQYKKYYPQVRRYMGGQQSKYGILLITDKREEIKNDVIRASVPGSCLIFQYNEGDDLWCAVFAFQVLLKSPSQLKTLE